MLGHLAVSRSLVVLIVLVVVFVVVVVVVLASWVMCRVARHVSRRLL